MKKFKHINNNVPFYEAIFWDGSNQSELKKFCPNIKIFKSEYEIKETDKKEDILPLAISYTGKIFDCWYCTTKCYITRHDVTYKPHKYKGEISYDIWSVDTFKKIFVELK